MAQGKGWAHGHKSRDIRKLSPDVRSGLARNGFAFGYTLDEYNSMSERERTLLREFMSEQKRESSFHGANVDETANRLRDTNRFEQEARAAEVEAEARARGESASDIRRWRGNLHREARSLGYRGAKDPRLNRKTSFGLMYGRDLNQMVLDTEALSAGYGSRPYELATGRVSRAWATELGNPRDVFVPLEMLYEEQLVGEVARDAMGRKASQLGLYSQPGLKRRFKGDFYRARRRMGLSESTIASQFDIAWNGESHSAYGKVFARNMHIPLDINDGSAAKALLDELSGAGINANRRTNIIAANAAYDMGNIYELTSMAKRSAGRAMRRADEAGDIAGHRTYSALVDRANSVKEAIFGKQGQGGAYVTDILQMAGLENFPGGKLVTPSASQFNRALGVEPSAGAHGALDDIKQLWAALGNWRKMGSAKSTAGQKPHSLMDVLMGAARRPIRYKIETRKPLIWEVQQALKEVGPARIQMGVLSGLQVKGFDEGFAGPNSRGRFGIDLVLSSKKPGLITPSSAASEKLLGHMQDLLVNGTEIEKSAINDLLSTSKLQDPDFLKNLVGLHSRMADKPINELIGMTHGYESPSQRIGKLVTRGATLDDLLKSDVFAGADELGKRTMLAESAINSRYQQFGKAIFGDGLFDRVGAGSDNRIIDTILTRRQRQFEGYLSPLERMRETITTKIYHNLGVVPDEAPANVKRLVDYISTETFSRAQDVLFRGATGDVGPMSAIGLGNIKGAKFANSVAMVGGSMIEEANYQGITGLSKIIDEAGLSAELEPKVRALNEQLFYGRVGETEFAASGIHARFNAISPFMQDVIRENIPHAGFSVIHSAEDMDSAGGVLADANMQYWNQLRTEMQRGGAAVAHGERKGFAFRQAAMSLGAAPDEWSASKKAIWERVTTSVKSNEAFQTPSLKEAEEFVGDITKRTRLSFNVTDAVDLVMFGPGELSIGQSLENTIMAASMVGNDFADEWSDADSTITHGIAIKRFGLARTRTEESYKALRSAIKSDKNWSAIQSGIGDAFYGGIRPAGADTPYMKEMTQEIRRYFKGQASHDHFSILQELNKDLVQKAARVQKMDEIEKASFFKELFTDMFTGGDNPGSIMTRAEGRMVPLEGQALQARFGEIGGMWDILAGREGQVPQSILEQVPLLANAQRAELAAAELGDLNTQIREGIMRSRNWDMGLDKSLFGMVGQGNVNANVIDITGGGFVDAKGLAMSEGRVAWTLDDGGRVVSRAIGRNEGEKAYREIAHMNISGKEIDWTKNLTLPELFDVSPELGHRVAAASNVQFADIIGPGGTRDRLPSVRYRAGQGGSIIDELATGAMRQSGDDESRHLQYLIEQGMDARGRRAVGADVIADVADAATAGSRGKMSSIGKVISELPASWKVVAAGIAGAAAITMMRRNKPLLPQENGTYGAMNGAMAYPMGYNPVGDTSSYMSPPPTQGVRASISGMMGSDFNVGDIQSMFGQMGMANININDNSRSISSRDVDKMMRSNL